MYVLTLAPGVDPFAGDPFFYHATGNALATSGEYVQPLPLLFKHVRIPTAEHPPLFPLLIAGLAELGGTSDKTQRLILGCAAAMALAVVIALLGRRVGNPRVGLIAAGLTVLSPLFLTLQGLEESEPIFGVAVAGALLLAYRVRERPTLLRAVALGIVLGLAALVRSEGLLLLLVIPLLAVRPLPARRLQIAVVTIVAGVLVVSPWIARNWDVFGRPVFSNNVGTLIAGTNCRSTYYGKGTGTFALCYRPPTLHNEADGAAQLRRSGLQYARDHASRLPVVAAVRLLRFAGFYRYPLLDLERIGRTPRWLATLEFLFYCGLLVAAVMGARLLIKSRRLDPVLLVPVVLMTVITALSWGTPRFRHVAEIVLILMAAIAIENLVDRDWRQRAAATEPASVS